VSFDIFLCTHNYTGEMRESENPFTGEMVKGPVDAGVSPHERRMLAKLFAAFHAKGPDESGCYALDLPDGGEAEVYADSLSADKPFTGCMLAIRAGVTPQLCDFIWRMANMGRMSIHPAMEDTRPIATDEAHLQLAPSDWKDAVVCHTPQELAVVLQKGFSAWDEFKRSVLGHGRGTGDAQDERPEGASPGHRPGDV